MAVLVGMVTKNFRLIVLVVGLVGVLSMLHAEERSAAMAEQATKLIEDHLAQGRQLMQLNRLPDALVEFEKILNVDPGHAEAMYLMSVIYMQQGDESKGMEFLNKAVDAAPENQRLRLVLAKTYERQKKVDDAEMQYLRIVQQGGDTPEVKEADLRARIIHGIRAGVQRDFEEAYNTFSQLLADYPGEPDVLINLTYANVQLGKIDEARLHVEHLTKLQPSNASAFRILGDIYEKQGEFDRAIESYDHILRVVPGDSPDSRLALYRISKLSAQRYLRLGDMEKATIELERMLTIDPNDPIAHFNLALIHRKNKKNSEAMYEFKKVVEFEPGNLEARYQLAILYIELNQLEDGARELEQLISDAPQSALARNASDVLGKLYAHPDGRPVRAKLLNERIKALQDKVKNNPDDFDAAYALAQLYINNNDFTSARPYLEEAVRIKPDFPQLQFNLAVLYYELGLFDLSLPALSRALGHETNESAIETINRLIMLSIPRKSFADKELDVAEIQFRKIIESGELKGKKEEFLPHAYLALIYTTNEQYDLAIQEYLAVLEVAPGNVLANVNLARLYAQVGREEDALVQCRAILQMEFSPAVISEVRQLMDELQRKVGGFSYNLGYSWGYDTNSNLNDFDPSEELSSTLSGSILYRYKLNRRPITMGLSFSPQYSISHYGQYDSIRYATSPFVGYNRPDYSYEASYSYTKIASLLTEQLSSYSHGVNLVGTWRFKLPALPRYWAEESEKKKANSVVSLGLSYLNSENAELEVYNSNIYSFSSTFSQGLGGGKSWTFSYSYSGSENLEDVVYRIPIPDPSNPTIPLEFEGSPLYISLSSTDYPTRGHSFSLRMDKGFSSGVNFYAALTYSYNNYKYPDSNDRWYRFRYPGSTFPQRRTNTMTSATLGASYYLTRQLMVFANLGYMENESTLPVAIIFSSEAVTTSQGVTPSLGSYRKTTSGLGLTLRF